MRPRNTIAYMFILAFLYGCDALITLPYVVKNKTGKSIYLKMNYPVNSSPFADKAGKDTIIELRKNKSIVVGYKQGITFPWAYREIYNKQRSCYCFAVIDHDTIVKLKENERDWKYHNKSSVLKIR